MSEHQTEKERDMQDEARYAWRHTYPADARLSTPALVARDREELAVEFMGDLAAGRVAGSANEITVREWEIARFGAELCPSAHGMLWRAVYALKTHATAGNFWPSQATRDHYEGHVVEYPKRDDEGSLAYVERIAVMVAGIKPMMFEPVVEKPKPPIPVLPPIPEGVTLPYAEEPDEDAPMTAWAAKAVAVAEAHDAPQVEATPLTARAIDDTDDDVWLEDLTRHHSPGCATTCLDCDARIEDHKEGRSHECDCRP